jgi:hypothetical protein
MRQFTLEISYSQIAIFNAALDRPFNNWTEDHFNQGFCWRQGSVSFRTAAKSGQGKVTIERLPEVVLRDDAIVAISVPFEVTGQAIEVASVFKGEVVDMEPGGYELVYQTGRHGVTPWVVLQFIPRKIEAATILKGAEHLKPPPELIMSAEPA